MGVCADEPVNAIVPAPELFSSIVPPVRFILLCIFKVPIPAPLLITKAPPVCVKLLTVIVAEELETIRNCPVPVEVTVNVPATVGNVPPKLKLPDCDAQFQVKLPTV